MKEYKISVSPRILELLGPNLYTNIYYVLAELIANAYDADAHNVYIISCSDNIRVEDDGHGMSYEDGDIEKFLSVASISRSNEKDSFSKSGSRRKMGRKGVGKLAALSVSETVEIHTSRNGEKSGFILSRHPKNDNKLEAIPDDKVSFLKVDGDGTAVVMRNPRYTLNKTLPSIKRNLLKIFPLINNDFQIHLIIDGKTDTLKDYDENIAKELCAIITLGDEHKKLLELVPDTYPSRRDELVEGRPAYTSSVKMTNNGITKEYPLEIYGWIGAYKTTKGRKAELTDFPDNFISLYANKKMGEFNILPIVGQNKLNEVYIVGQLFIDLFEKSELPDMALSNRQGYKSDDPRYVEVISYVREKLLPNILKKRSTFSDLLKEKKRKEHYDASKKAEVEFRKSVDIFKENTSQSIASSISIHNNNNIKDVVFSAINDHIGDLGIKRTGIERDKKKILISHTLADKPLADIIYKMLQHNNIPSEYILYTNCDDEICRIPEGVSVYEYLRDFFVESYSKEKIFVLFITSENTPKAWGAMTEIGAAWITQIDNKIFNIPPFTPKHPLDDESTWHSTNREGNQLSMSKLNADIFCQKIENVCTALGYTPIQRTDNRTYLESLVSII